LIYLNYIFVYFQYKNNLALETHVSITSVQKIHTIILKIVKPEISNNLQIIFILIPDRIQNYPNDKVTL